MWGDTSSVASVDIYLLHTSDTRSILSMYLFFVDCFFMIKTAVQPDGTFDVDSLRLPSCAAAPVSPSEPVRFRRGQRFLRGPIPWEWLSVSARLPGKALQVSLAVWHLAGLKNAMTVELSRGPLESLGVTRQAAYRGLNTLENAGLIKAARRRGSKTRVTIVMSS
jgi:hypothetical protein